MAGDDGVEFPGGLPEEPPTPDEAREMYDRWTNVYRINDIEWSRRGDTRVLTYMIVNTDEGRGYRVIWEMEKKGQWFIKERSSTY